MNGNEEDVDPLKVEVDENIPKVSEDVAYLNVSIEGKSNKQPDKLTEKKKKPRNKPHSCSICQNRFATISHLKTHIENVHEKKKQSCSICQAQFAGKQNLNRHIATIHEGKRPHKCHICNSTFKQSYDLKVHVAFVHEKKGYKCSIS